MRSISNSDEVIDSRDVIERIEELKADQSGLVDNVESARNDEERKTSKIALEEWNEENADELTVLINLADDGEANSSDWIHGETLIRESYWVDYVEELCKDIGDMPKEIPHYIAIDWEATADNISVDYSTVDFDGVTYYMRSC